MKYEHYNEIVESDIMLDMDNKHILTYGLSKDQNVLLESTFGAENVFDVTGDIVTLCTCPAAAIVIKTDILNIRDIDTLNHMFGDEYNTAKILIPSEPENAAQGHEAGKSSSWNKRHTDSRDFNFISCTESDTVNMTETIEEIKKRYAIHEEYKKAVSRMEPKFPYYHTRFALDQASSGVASNGVTSIAL